MEPSAPVCPRKSRRVPRGSSFDIQKLRSVEEHPADLAKPLLACQICSHGCFSGSRRAPESALVRQGNRRGDIIARIFTYTGGKSISLPLDEAVIHERERRQRRGGDPARRDFDSGIGAIQCIEHRTFAAVDVRAVDRAAVEIGRVFVDEFVEIRT